MQTSPKEHVFLSYCHENKKEVERLRRALLQRGEAVFWDGDLLPGQNIQHALSAALRKSYAFVLCMSKEAAARSRSGIFIEARDAVAALRQYPPGAVFVIVVRISPCEIPALPIDATTSLPDLLHLDLFPDAAFDGQVDRLVEAIRATPDHP